MQGVGDSNLKLLSVSSLTSCASCNSLQHRSSTDSESSVFSAVRKSDTTSRRGFGVSRVTAPAMFRQPLRSGHGPAIWAYAAVERTSRNEFPYLPAVCYTAVAASGLQLELSVLVCSANSFSINTSAS